jgi:hypothetical protein
MRLMMSVRRLASRGRVNAGASGERARQRIREMDAQKSGRTLPLHDGGSLSSEHTAAQLASLCEKADVAELGERDDGKRCFVLQHATEPSARLAQVWLLPGYPPGRFDAGVAGSAGVGPTLQGAQTHASLPLAAAAPLVAHVLHELRHEPSVEAVAALPGLSAWIATFSSSQLEGLDGDFGRGATDAAMVMALDGERILAYPEGIRMRTVARPLWEALAAQYAQSAAAEEAALYRDAGASDCGIAYVADVSSDGLRQSGGALGLFHWQQHDGSETRE